MTEVFWFILGIAFLIGVFIALGIMGCILTVLIKDIGHD